MRKKCCAGRRELAPTAISSTGMVRSRLLFQKCNKNERVRRSVGWQRSRPSHTEGTNGDSNLRSIGISNTRRCFDFFLVVHIAPRSASTSMR